MPKLFFLKFATIATKPGRTRRHKSVISFRRTYRHTPVPPQKKERVLGLIMTRSFFCGGTGVWR